MVLYQFVLQGLDFELWEWKEIEGTLGVYLVLKVKRPKFLTLTP